MYDLTIEAGRSEKHYWRDLWRYRELFLFLAWRDILIRYKQTAIGVAWAVIQPLATMAVLTIIFGKLAGFPSEGGAPYAIMVFAAMLPWQFFANALAASSQSLVGNANLISKVYFPRIIIPAGSLAVASVDFLISFAIMLGMMAWYGFWPHWRILTLPLFILLTLGAGLGPGLLVTALNVKYRDFRYVIPFVIQFGLYISPVAFSSSVIREKWGETIFLCYSLNPMVGVIDGFRWAILGQSELHPAGLLISVVSIVVFCIAGIRYFRKTEKSFADVI